MGWDGWDGVFAIVDTLVGYMYVCLCIYPACLPAYLLDGFGMGMVGMEMGFKKKLLIRYVLSTYFLLFPLSLPFLPSTLATSKRSSSSCKRTMYTHAYIYT